MRPGGRLMSTPSTARIGPKYFRRETAFTAGDTGEPGVAGGCVAAAGCLVAAGVPVSGVVGGGVGAKAITYLLFGPESALRRGGAGPRRPRRCRSRGECRFGRAHRTRSGRAR